MVVGGLEAMLDALELSQQSFSLPTNSPKMFELAIDIGARDKKEAEARVSVGDPISFDEGFMPHLHLLLPENLRRFLSPSYGFVSQTSLQVKMFWEDSVKPGCEPGYKR